MDSLTAETAPAETENFAELCHHNLLSHGSVWPIAKASWCFKPQSASGQPLSLFLGIFYHSPIGRSGAGDRKKPADKCQSGTEAFLLRLLWRHAACRLERETPPALAQDLPPVFGFHTKREFIGPV